eukprot:Em0006g311a
MEIELKMKLETILSGFMVLDSKNRSLAGQALDMMLKLVAPEYKHKSWNYFGLYTNYLERERAGLNTVLIYMQGPPFWLLEQSHSCAIEQL